MDVDRIQKVNDLAINLMQQGLAQNRDEAIAQAEKIFKERDTEDYSQIRETMGETKQEVKKEEPKEDNCLSQDKIKDILQQNTDYIVRKLKEFKEELDETRKELSFLKSKVNLQRTQVPPPQQPVSEVKQESQTEPVKEQQTQKPAEQPKSNANHPRSGGYNDGDVSIEKFFYMGNK